MSLDSVVRALAGKAGVEVYTPEDHEEKLELVRRLESYVAYQQFMAEFESPEEYWAFVNDQLEQGDKRRALCTTA